MKKSLLFACFVLLLMQSLSAQIQLLGAANGYRPGKIDILEWQIFDSATVQVFPTDLDAYLVATSGYDAYNGKYYLSGLSNQNGGNVLLEFDANNNTQSFNPGTLVSNISEFDMATGTMYKLTMDAQKNILVYATNLSTNQDSLIGSIQEPNAVGLVLDAISIDANLVATLNQSADGKLEFTAQSEQKLKMVSSGSSYFPIAVKANRIDFDKGVFNGLALVTDTRNFF
jgi:hypothetical protein